MMVAATKEIHTNEATDVYAVLAAIRSAWFVVWA